MKPIFLLPLLLIYSFTSCYNQTLPNKIPLDGKRWYQLNNTTDGLEQLSDGDLYTYINTGYGKMLSNFDAYYPLLDGEQMVVDSVRFYDYYGTLGIYPITLYVINSKWQRIKLASFNGSQSNVWVGPKGTTTRLIADTIVKDARYLVINAWYAYPTEMELFGKYTAPPASATLVKPVVTLKDFFGVDAYEWDFEDPANPLVLDATRTNTIKTFSAIRHYLDWDKLEATKRNYTYNPTHNGGWNYDTIYKFCKDNNILMLADLKSLPNYILNTYAVVDRDKENVPVSYYGADFTDPNSYIDEAKLAFQFAARYGSNKNVNPTLIKIDATTRWTGDPANTVRIGLGYVKYMECDNERDKWWKGRKAYQTGREYAANMSAFYDGNMKTMGPGVGVKNADPNMQVVMGGTASFTPDYVRGMIDWCKQYRGYKADGSVNYCWDVINYHFYNSDVLLNGTNTASVGVAPELSHADTLAMNMVQAAHLYGKDMPIWVTESGYDDYSGSPYRAISIGSKAANVVKADWILRTSLLYARTGVQKLFFYQELDDNSSSVMPFGTCGLVNNDFTRRAAANYIYQVSQKFGDYVYTSTIQQNPIIDVYKLNGKTLYVVTSPTQTGKTVLTTINLGRTTSAVVYTPTATGDNMASSNISTVNNILSITATETPQFILVSDAVNAIAKN